MGLQRSPGFCLHTFRRLGACRAQRHVHSLLKSGNSSRKSPPKQSLQGPGCGSETPSQMRGGVNPEGTLLPRGWGMEGKKNQVSSSLQGGYLYFPLFCFLKQFFVSEYQ